MSDDAKCYAATPAKTLEQHIMDPNIAKNEAEWWAHHEIEKLRAALKPFADKEHAYDGWADTARNAVWLNIGDLRAAKAALGESDD